MFEFISFKSTDEKLEFQERMISYLAVGENVGLSSRYMLSVLAGVPQEKNRTDVNRPYDKGDFGRCVNLINEFPELKPHIDKLKGRDRIWDNIVYYWDQLCDLAEHGDHQSFVSLLERY